MNIYMCRFLVIPDMHETKKAQELGGHLVSIHSAEEIEFISTLANFGMKEDDATKKSLAIILV